MMNSIRQLRRLAVLVAAACAAAQAWSADPPKPAAAKPAPAKAATGTVAIAPQTLEYTGPTDIAPALRVATGKSALVRLQADATRLSIGDPAIADVTLINPREIYLLGKKAGSTNIFIWAKGGRTTLMDVVVSLDTATLKARLADLVPGESGVSVESVGDSVVLGGNVADAMKVHRLVSLAELYAGSGKKVVNLLNVQGNQQVMLEVKVAEVSKTLVDKLGSELSLTRTMGGTTFTLLGEMLTGTASSITATRPNGRTTLSLDAEIKNGLVKILAEPTIMAMSGQEGTFLAGGKIYIPVPQSSGIGTSSITLEEKEFGVGLRFLPTVLDEGRINLRVSPEVSELSQVGTAVTTGNTTSILPTITTRRASTTVQLRDGESFAIGGLIKHNVTEAVKAMPGVGEMPVLGALFRSTEFQTDRSELLFIVTPRLVKPLPPNAPLPTDNFVEPTRLERLIDGRVVSATPPAKPAPAAPVPPAGGFKLN
jgi:pilus assembly protein CpaC